MSTAAKSDTKTDSGNVPAIHPAIIAVMGSIGAIGKDRRNKEQGFQYRGIDDVYNALQPAMVAAKMYMVPEVISAERGHGKSKNGTDFNELFLRVRVHFISAVDGSEVVAEVEQEARDYADKASGKALSMAVKYAAFTVFCIPTEEPESDAAHIEGKAETRTTSPATNGNGKPPADPAAAEYRKTVEQLLADKQHGWSADIRAAVLALVAPKRQQDAIAKLRAMPDVSPSTHELFNADGSFILPE